MASETDGPTIIHRAKEQGPPGWPVRLVAMAVRHGEKQGEGLTLRGELAAATKGVLLRNSGDFAGLTTKPYVSPKDRTVHTITRIMRQVDPMFDETQPMRAKGLLLGFGSAGERNPEDNFWGVEGQRTDAVVTRDQEIRDPALLGRSRDELEEEVIKEWLRGEDRELVGLHNPVDAAADTSVAVARAIGSLSLVTSSLFPQVNNLRLAGYDTDTLPVTDIVGELWASRPLVRENAGLIGGTHRGVWEPWMTSGVLLHESGKPVTDIEAVGGVLGFLDSVRLEAQRDAEGLITASFRVDKLSGEEGDSFDVDFNKLNELYTLGVWRIRQRRAGKIS
ncbi:hypothetical protein A2631_04960 [Candidatus Daviesbacteria bacterium RIFCSPHIGHO2_01_FULL_44_29]|uniref:Uncharacterized protein n=1 Tax=Candidatus Daviesbacteria bacterium RIFCSPHIGHO2_02_FULL_43_12 TaxID=1797776 RepID=A0A1F5KGL8_9BACT|nr:MAG: hypothetical protein A2631_04960 [Candidatus Daviesbacteria bacterium RIFCSPHIGHO2_01_FULL_44_29]OGE40072.1 MAG: hypothetical protein A3D25_04690 [Candidatus Daviesbacteria bacterium RIFCSPHIGHO2_02_FULL_43_12]OGE41446.1 MAG: hypothetical protein A3E86_05120 [Candidatus Daviesbacteria bacterium RIFCSPHIGHO2_12_FULL_47_45]OGE70248.1 MAG: hypothetical protein A3B55_00880 [Candidatus Daviesbacteria bacterium RIFCSPLOWO2_01_FULL_43_15]